MQVIINKIATVLCVKDGVFLLKNSEGDQSFAPPKVKSILLNPGTSLTYEAIVLAVESGIDILFTERSGFPVARIWTNRFGSIATIRKQQVAFSQSEQATQWVKQILIRKIENQGLILSMIDGYQTSRSPIIRDAIAKLEVYRVRLSETAQLSLQDAAGTFRGLEGKSGAVYFGVIGGLLPDKYRFGKRSQHPAADMFNAMLNYAYGMLYGKIETALIKAGVDPFLGVFHRDEYNRPVLTYDWIEQYRIWADYVVIKLCMEHVIFIEFFEIKPDGAFWLAADGKRILIQSLNDYLEEVVVIKGISRSRLHHIDWDITQFAGMLKTFGAKKNEM